MKKIPTISFLAVLVVMNSCSKIRTAADILQNTIATIDTIETIYYKQDMYRSNPRNIEDSIFRYREMYFKRLRSDSIVGLQGHWYMYLNDNEKVVFEDIYDGSRLIRKNNQIRAARVYDLIKYPDFKNMHFWSHNTLYGMQYEFRYYMDHPNSYSIERLNDTIIDSRECYQVLVSLTDKMTMPGFAINLENSEGSISKTYYFIDKETHYPIKTRGENYTMDNPDQKVFIDQRYYDIKFNQNIDDQKFNTSEESISEYEITEIKPKDLGN